MTAQDWEMTAQDWETTAQDWETTAQAAKIVENQGKAGF